MTSLTRKAARWKSPVVWVGVGMGVRKKRAHHAPTSPSCPSHGSPSYAGLLPAAIRDVAGDRKSVEEMQADHQTLVSYQTAIAAMQKLPPTDPLSWRFQASMHGTLGEDGANAAWSWCMHGNWWFLPWHRGYLYFFERIIRK